MLLEVKNLCVAYDDAVVIDDVNLNVSDGERVAIIGPNGAGKSTFLKAVAGIIKPRSGDIFFQGRSTAKLAASLLSAQQSIVFIPQGKRVFPSLTVLENIKVMLEKVKGEERNLRINELTRQFPILAERANLLAGRLSGGEQQIVALARALVIKPKLILLDEPFHGLSPQWISYIFEKIKSIDDASIVLVEQNVAKALAFASRVYVFKNGRVARQGCASQISATAQLDWGLAAETTTVN